MMLSVTVKLLLPIVSVLPWTVKLPITVKLPCAVVVAAAAPKLVSPARVVTLGRYAAVLALAPVAKLVIPISWLAALPNNVVMFVVAVPKLASMELILVVCVAALAFAYV